MRTAPEWTNLVASVGVLAGLLLVAYELRQNNEIAAAENYRSIWSSGEELNTLGIETDILQVWTKSIDDPLSLTDEEITRLDAYLWRALDHHLVKAVLSDKYGLYDVPLEQVANHAAEWYLTDRFGRAWFEMNHAYFASENAEFAQAISDYLARTPVWMKRTGPEDLRAKIRRFEESEQL